jgi:thiol-disulfide isomerase/thioredoxin
LKRVFPVLLLVLGACGGLSHPPSAVVPEAPYYAPDFTATALNGDVYTLSALRGRWVILNFWATWCAPCVAEMPALQMLADEYAGQLVVLGINPRESSEVVATFAAAHDLRFPLLIDPDDATLVDYQVVGLPQSLVISPEGEIVDRQFGPLELDAFRQKIRLLMSAAPSVPPGQ